LKGENENEKEFIMKFWKKIAGGVKSPLNHITNEIQEELAETATVTTQAVMEHFGNTLPEIADLLSGEPVELDLTITIRLRQKGEPK
jgi:hypothetical protein